MTAPVPEPGTLPVLTCLPCGHDINKHAAHRECGVDGYGRYCTCRWTPNDIAATLIQEAVEKTARHADGLGMDLLTQRKRWTDLREQVQALPHEDGCDMNLGAHGDEPCDCLIADVLALLGES